MWDNSKRNFGFTSDPNSVEYVPIETVPSSSAKDSLVLLSQLFVTLSLLPPHFMYVYLSVFISFYQSICLYIYICLSVYVCISICLERLFWGFPDFSITIKASFISLKIVLRGVSLTLSLEICLKYFLSHSFEICLK